MCCYTSCVFIDIGICMRGNFIGISTKVHYIFYELRKWILAKQNLRKESEFYNFSYDA